jgi:hypothetical protein
LFVCPSQELLVHAPSCPPLIAHMFGALWDALSGRISTEEKRKSVVHATIMLRWVGPALMDPMMTPTTDPKVRMRGCGARRWPSVELHASHVHWAIYLGWLWAFVCFACSSVCAWVCYTGCVLLRHFGQPFAFCDLTAMCLRCFVTQLCDTAIVIHSVYPCGSTALLHSDCYTQRLSVWQHCSRT